MGVNIQQYTLFLVWRPRYLGFDRRPYACSKVASILSVPFRQRWHGTFSGDGKCFAVQWNLHRMIPRAITFFVQTQTVDKEWGQLLETSMWAEFWQVVLDGLYIVISWMNPSPPSLLFCICFGTCRVWFRFWLCSYEKSATLFSILGENWCSRNEQKPKGHHLVFARLRGISRGMFHM